MYLYVRVYIKIILLELMLRTPKLFTRKFCEMFNPKQTETEEHVKSCLLFKRSINFMRE